LAGQGKEGRKGDPRLRWLDDVEEELREEAARRLVIRQ
jgi:hypothetical protein